MEPKIIFKSLVLPGSITYLRRGTKTYCYLTWTRKKKSGALYLPPSILKEVEEGIRNYQEAKDTLTRQAFKNLERLKAQRNCTPRRRIHQRRNDALP